MDDFMDVSLEMAKYPGYPGQWFIPNLLTVRILAYQKELFEDPAERSAFKQKYGYELDPPETTSELLDIAEFFTRDTTGDGRIDMWGYAFPQKPDTWSWEYAVHLIWTFGGNVVDKDFKVNINSPWSIEGFEFGKELQKYQPPGVLGWNVEHIDLFKQGKLAMTAIWHEKADRLNDPELSPIAGKVGYSVLPKYEENPWGYTAGSNRVGGGGLAVMKDSKNKEAAFQFIKWQTSKELALPLYKEGGNLVRKSAFELKEIMALRPWLADLFPVVKEALLGSAVHRPSIPEAYAMQIEIANAWQRFIMGEATAEEALKYAHDTINQMLEKAGYYD